MKELLICNSDELFSRNLAAAAEKCGLSVIICGNAQQARVHILSNTPDVVVFDMILPGYDGLEFLSQNVECGARFICVTEFINDYVITASRAYGAAYIMPKSMPIDIIVERIGQIGLGAIDYLQPSKNAADEQLEKEITRMLGVLGIQHGRLGFQYAKSTLMEMISCNNNVSIGRIYEKIAPQYDTRPNCVERSIRSAIEDAWTKGSLGIIEEIFGYSIKADKGKPTNKEFLSVLYERLRLRI